MPVHRGVAVRPAIIPDAVNRIQQTVLRQSDRNPLSETSDVVLSADPVCHDTGRSCPWTEKAHRAFARIPVGRHDAISTGMEMRTEVAGFDLPAREAVQQAPAALGIRMPASAAMPSFSLS